MTSKETLDARIKVAQEFSKLFANPLFNKEFMLLTDSDSNREYNSIIVAAPEEKIGPTLERFLKTNEPQASIASTVDGEVLIRVVSPVEESDSDLKIFDIYDDTTVYSWLSEENLHPEGIHVINGKKVKVSGNLYRKAIEKLCGFADN